MVFLVELGGFVESAAKFAEFGLLVVAARPALEIQFPPNSKIPPDSGHCSWHLGSRIFLLECL